MVSSQSSMQEVSLKKICFRIPFVYQRPSVVILPFHFQGDFVGFLKRIMKNVLCYRYLFYTHLFQWQVDSILAVAEDPSSTKT